MSVTVNNKRMTNGRVVCGTWTHSEGEANESVTIPGYIFGGQITVHDASGSVDNAIRYSISRSTTTGVSTVTFHYGADVTDGRFYFFTSSM